MLDPYETYDMLNYFSFKQIFFGGGGACLLCFLLFPTKTSSIFLHMKLVEQVKELERTISQHCGEREELIGHLNQIKEDHSSSSQNTESMAGKIKVRRKCIMKYVPVCGKWSQKHLVITPLVFPDSHLRL